MKLLIMGGSLIGPHLPQTELINYENHAKHYLVISFLQPLELH